MVKLECPRFPAFIFHQLLSSLIIFHVACKGWIDVEGLFYNRDQHSPTFHLCTCLQFSVTDMLLLPSQLLIRDVHTFHCGSNITDILVFLSQITVTPMTNFRIKYRPTVCTEYAFPRSSQSLLSVVLIAVTLPSCKMTF